MKYPDDFINKIICGDCLEIMKKIPNECIDLIITSPPYNLPHGISHGRHHMKYGEISLLKGETEYYDWTKNILDELLRVCKRHVFYIIQLISNNKKTFLKIFGDYSEKIKEIIIWNKLNPQPAIERGVLNSAFEFIIILSKDNPQKRKFKEVIFHGDFNNVISGNSVNNPYSKLIRAIFPEYLISKLIEEFSFKEDIILDPMCGSGTTAKVTKDLKRNFIGIEINPDYCKIAEERLAQGVL